MINSLIYRGNYYWFQARFGSSTPDIFFCKYKLHFVHMIVALITSLKWSKLVFFLKENHLYIYKRLIDTVVEMEQKWATTVYNRFLLSYKALQELSLLLRETSLVLTETRHVSWELKWDSFQGKVARTVQALCCILVYFPLK